jgi:hypothetical protein
MALTVKLATTNALVVDSETGKVTINFDGGTSLEFEQATDLSNLVADYLPQVENLRAWLIVNRLANDPLLDSPALWEGKLLTFDVEQALATNVFKVTG